MRPLGFSPMRTVEGFGSEVFPHPYHIPATPTPRRKGPALPVLNMTPHPRAQPAISVATPRSTRESPRPRREPVRSRWECHFPAHSEFETPVGPFRLGRRVHRRVVPARSPPGARRIREMLPQEQCWCAPPVSARDNSEHGTAPTHAPARAPQRSVPTRNTRRY